MCRVVAAPACGELTECAISGEAVRKQGKVLEYEETSPGAGEMAGLRAEVRSLRTDWSATLSGVSDVVWVVDRAYRVVDANGAFLRRLGLSREEGLMRPCFQIVRGRECPCTECPVAHAFESGEPGRALLRLEDGARGQSEFEVTASPAAGPGGVVQRVVCCGRDVTRERALERGLRQMQRAATVGQFANGIMHDLSTLIMVIQGYGELLLGQELRDASDRSALREIHTAGQRAAELTRQLLAFSRQRPSAARETIMVNALMREMEGMLRCIVGEDVLLATALDPALWAVSVFPGQIEQIVMNLAVNARDAMPDGGKITITTRNLSRPESLAHQAKGLRPGAYVHLTFSDTGCGMTAEAMRRSFEPFFTTKERNAGTGLGLSVVRAIAEENGGRIWVESGLGLGAAFTVCLPRSQGGRRLTGRQEAMSAAMPAWGEERPVTAMRE